MRARQKRAPRDAGSIDPSDQLAPRHLAHLARRQILRRLPVEEPGCGGRGSRQACHGDEWKDRRHRGEAGNVVSLDDVGTGPRQRATNVERQARQGR